MIICVCGGRVGVEEPRRVYALLDAIWKRLGRPQDVTLVHGEAMGYDRMAGFWARRRRFNERKVRIDPELDGHDDEAPKRRNRRMLRENAIEVLIGFPGGPGTRDMMAICHDAGVRVLDVEFGDERVDIHEWAATAPTEAINR